MRIVLLTLIATVLPAPFVHGQAAHPDDVLASSMPASNARFGDSVSLDGDRLAVGAPQKLPVGVGWVFERGEDGVWNEVGLLVPPPAPSALRMGRAIAIDDSRVLLGADRCTSVHVYEQQGSTWSYASSITTTGLSFSTDGFGRALDLEGDRAVVGNPESDDLGSQFGAAHVFEWNGTSWDVVADLYPSTAATGMAMGTSVALAGDYAAVGAPGAGAGSVFVFERQPDGEWSEVDELSAPAAAGEFGSSVSMQDELLFVGAPAASSAGPESGKVFLFERQLGGGWQPAGELEASDATQGMRFGNTLDLEGDRLAVGTEPPTGAGASALGRAYLFERSSGGTWSERVRLRDPGVAADESGGFAVAVDGDLVASTAPGATDVVNAEGTCALFGLRPLMRSDASLSLSAGGVQEWFLSAGEERAGEAFGFLGTASGTEPGLVLSGGVGLPLNFDAYWSFTANKLAANPLIAPSLGLLDLAGRGTSGFVVPAGVLPPLVGLTLHHAFFTYDGAAFTSASNAVAVVLEL